MTAKPSSLLTMLDFWHIHHSKPGRKKLGQAVARKEDSEDRVERTCPQGFATQICCLISSPTPNSSPQLGQTTISSSCADLVNPSEGGLGGL
jgi:hypothetical protein